LKKNKLRTKTRKKYQKKKKNPMSCGELLMYDMIEITFCSLVKLETKYIAIDSLYKTFLLNKLYYTFEYEIFEKYIKIIFPKYKNKKKQSTKIKVSRKYILRVMREQHVFINFKNLNIMVLN